MSDKPESRRCVPLAMFDEYRELCDRIARLRKSHRLLFDDADGFAFMGSDVPVGAAECYMPLDDGLRAVIGGAIVGMITRLESECEKMEIDCA